jgi:selenide,water dikinase
MEAGCTIIGGHSIRDDETKFGYSVTGLIDPNKVLKNGGAKPGDRLLLTKSLGTGVISTAIKQGLAKQSWIDAAVSSMTTLNKTSAEVIGKFQERRMPDSSQFLKGGDLANDRRPTTNDTAAIHALTDITGFGLIGHAREMALASNVSLQLNANRIPLLDGALECVRAGHIPGGLKANREFAECVVQYAYEIPEDLKTILFDPQTAGGLLVSVSSEAAPELTRALGQAGVPAVDIGEVVAQSKPLISVSH